MATLPIDFSKINSLSDAEKTKLLNSFTHDEILSSFDMLISSIPPELIMEKLRSRDYTTKYVAQKLVTAGANPEEILAQITDEDLARLDSFDRIALLTDQTAERIICGFGSLDYFVRVFLYHLNGSGKKLPPNLLRRKIQSLFRNTQSGIRGATIISNLENILVAGIVPDDLLDFISGFNSERYAPECRLLLEYGVTPEKLAKKIADPELELVLYEDLKAHGVEFSMDEMTRMVKSCRYKLESLVPTLLKNGVPAQLLADEIPLIKEFDSFRALLEAGASAKSMYDKLDEDMLEENYEKLETYVDFNILTHQRFEKHNGSIIGFAKFLARHAKWLTLHGVDQDIILKGLSRVYNINPFLDELFDCIEPARLKELMGERLTKDQSDGAFPTIIKHYSMVVENGIVSMGDMSRLAEKWYGFLWEGSWTFVDTKPIDFLLEYLDTILIVYPDLIVYQMVNRLLTTELRWLLTKHLATLVSQDINVRGLVEELVKDPVGGTIGPMFTVDFSTIELIMDQGFTADWFIKNAHPKFFSSQRKMDQEEVRYYIGHGADPDMVACIYLRNHQYDAEGVKNLDEIIGQPTIWSKLLWD